MKENRFLLDIPKRGETIYLITAIVLFVIAFCTLLGNPDSGNYRENNIPAISFGYNPSYTDESGIKREVRTSANSNGINVKAVQQCSGAVYGDKTENFYIVTDLSHDHYLVYMDADRAAQIQAEIDDWSYTGGYTLPIALGDGMPPVPVTIQPCYYRSAVYITGSHLLMNDQTKELALENYNRLFGGETPATADQLSGIFGDYLINCTAASPQGVHIQLYFGELNLLFMGLFGFLALVFLFFFIRSRVNTANTLRAFGDRFSEVEAEISDHCFYKDDDIKLYVSKHYLVSGSGGLRVVPLKDIRWIGIRDHYGYRSRSISLEIDTASGETIRLASRSLARSSEDLSDLFVTIKKYLDENQALDK